MKLQWHNEKRRIADLILWDKNPRLLSDEQRQIREALNGMIRLHNRSQSYQCGIEIWVHRDTLTANDYTLNRTSVELK